MKFTMLGASVAMCCLVIGPVAADGDAAATPEVTIDLKAAEKKYRRECRGCHGPTAMGLASYPKLAAQPVDYLAGKLEAYRAGEKLGPNTPLMAPRARKLSDQDIANLAAFISGLPG